MVHSKDAEIRVRDLMIEKLKHQLAGHQRHRFGSKSETVDQLALDMEDREIAEAATSPQSEETASKSKDKPKAYGLPSTNFSRGPPNGATKKITNFSSFFSNHFPLGQA